MSSFCTAVHFITFPIIAMVSAKSSNKVQKSSKHSQIIWLKWHLVWN